MPQRLLLHPINVLVADCDVLACRLLASRLRKHRSFHVTECAQNAAATLELMRRVRPTVALISHNLPGEPRGGLTVLRETRSWSPRVRSVMLLENADQQSVVDAFRAGARGVFLRSAFSFESLCKCVHRVHQGQVWADSSQLVHVLDAFAQTEPIQLANSDGMKSLSKREKEVVRSVVEGYSNREIAVRLNLSEHTVKNYVFRVFEKLGISSRVELVHYTLAHGDDLSRQVAPTELASKAMTHQAVS
ncbi:MAG TPA: response regulator transcription factor [Terriglobales bacterium]|nr:response regulator transcription factor [Terriglobales bacterium]